MPDGFLELFPNASPDFLSRNSGKAPKLERGSKPPALEKGKAQGKHSGVLLVRITSVRARLLDEDNLCEKYHVDCLRYAGIISDDSPDKTRIETTQRKARKGEAERVEIEVFELP